MYNILVVDDERLERQGIKSLIKKFDLGLEVHEATNGEEALKLMKNVKVDILFTDIKMPYMNGMELAQRAKSINPSLKVIIYSAYGEFEYAKQAIDLNVIKYILKPIEINHFFETLTDTIRLCQSEEAEKRIKAMLQQEYQKNVLYEKQKVLLDIVRGVKVDGSFIERMARIGLDFTSWPIQMVLFDFSKKFFDANTQFNEWIMDKVQASYEYLNLNEYQSLIFIKCNADKNFSTWVMGENMKQQIVNKFGVDVCIVIGGPVNGPENIYQEFVRMDRMLDHRFFYGGSVVLMNENSDSNMEVSCQFVDMIIDNIYKYLDQGDYYNVQKSIELFFDKIQEQQVSVIYSKYVCAEMAKKIIHSSSNFKNKAVFKIVEEIFSASNLYKVKDLLMRMIKDTYTVSDIEPMQYNNKVIRDIINTIKQKYDTDISLQSLADQVYLSPSYLSYLFKKEMGQSVVQYITTYRLEKACELLRTTNIKINDIAQKVGYSNSSYFGSIFKSHYGVTPAQYREGRKVYESPISDI